MHWAEEYDWEWWNNYVKDFFKFLKEHNYDTENVIIKQDGWLKIEFKEKPLRVIQKKANWLIDMSRKHCHICWVIWFKRDIPRTPILCDDCFIMIEE